MPPGKFMQEATEQLTGSDDSYCTFRSLPEFVRRAEYYLDQGKTCILADVAYANGADNELMDRLAQSGVLSRLAGYGAWNTASNTLGVVMLQGVAAWLAGVQQLDTVPALRRFFLQKVVKDWAWQSNVQWAVMALLKGRGADGYCLGADMTQAGQDAVRLMQAFLKEHAATLPEAFRPEICSIRFSWNRIFDVMFGMKEEDDSCGTPCEAVS